MKTQTFSEAVKRASNYKTVTDIAVEDYSFYLSLDSRGWLKSIHKHLTGKRIIWLPETAFQEASKYKTRGDLKKACPSCFRWLKKSHLLDKACQHMFTGRSKGEEAVLKLLTDARIFFETEATFHFSKSYRFDFYLPEKNIVLEIHGRQHREFSKFYHKTEENFKARQAIDQEKKELILSNNIKYRSFDYTSQRKDSIEQMILKVARYLRIPINSQTS